jgi:hypothetical protein
MKTLKTENDVKKALKAMLTEIGAFRFSCAAGGYGGVYGISDDIVCYKGRFVAIESKRPGRREEENEGLSAHQVIFGKNVQKAGGLFFKVDDYASIAAVKRELTKENNEKSTAEECSNCKYFVIDAKNSFGFDGECKKAQYGSRLFRCIGEYSQGDHLYVKKAFRCREYEANQ